MSVHNIRISFHHAQKRGSLVNIKSMLDLRNNTHSFHTCVQSLGPEWQREGRMTEIIPPSMTPPEASEGTEEKCVPFQLCGRSHQHGIMKVVFANKPWRPWRHKAHQPCPGHVALQCHTAQRALTQKQITGNLAPHVVWESAKRRGARGLNHGQGGRRGDKPSARDAAILAQTEGQRRCWA